MNKQELALFVQLPPLPANATFGPREIDIIFDPHPFTATPLHVPISNSNGGVYNTTVANASPCAYACGKTFAQHIKRVILVIAVPRGNDMTTIAVPGLNTWLAAVKTAMGANTPNGFQFVDREADPNLSVA